MSKKVLIIGHQGRLGQVFVDWIESQKEYQLCHGVGRGDDLNDAILKSQPDTVVDVSAHDAVYANALKVIDAGRSLIIGASGLSKKNRMMIDKKAREKQVVVLFCPNFSLSSLLMLWAVKTCAVFFNEAHILEKHHINKKDSPSQTAKYTLESIEKAWQDKKHRQPIDIASIRSSGIVAEQEVLFSAVGERLKISAETTQREGFIGGFAYALSVIDALPTGLTEGLESLLFSKQKQ